MVAVLDLMRCVVYNEQSSVEGDEARRASTE